MAAPPSPPPSSRRAGRTRRDTLRLAAGLGLAVPLGTAWPGIAASAASSSPTRPMRLAAAWQQDDGGYRIGVLEAPHGHGGGNGNAPLLRALHMLEIPTRAHGLCPLSDGSIVAASRRPGDWLVRWWPGTGRDPLWQWSNGSRSFNGHVIASPDGRRLYTTETDADTGRSLIVVRDVEQLEPLQEWPTQGIDAHELLWDRRTLADDTPTLIVANGGVPTAPETGRVKRALDTMDSSVVRLHGQTGDLLGQWRLQDQRLSLRHMAWNAPGTVLGIALQAEHGDPDERQAAPVLALFDGSTLRPAEAASSAPSGGLRGYGGSIAATPEGWAVSCPRAQGIALFGPQGEWQRLVPLREVCALAVRGTALWAAGQDHSLEDARSARARIHPHAPALSGARIDNHWYTAGGGPTRTVEPFSER